MSPRSPMPARSNQAWVAALRDGDPQALDDLGAHIRRALRRGLGTRADVDAADLEDFAQDALLQVLESLHSFRGDSRFTTWVVTVAIRVGIAAIRKKGWGHRSLDDLDLQRVSWADDPAGAAERRDLVGVLERAIDEALTDRQRTVIRAELAGMPSQRIAEELGATPNAIYKTYHDARKKLRTALAAAGFGATEVRGALADASEEA